MKLDKGILKLLQDDCRITSEEISEAVALSPTAVQRRIKRLRECGAIVAEVAIVSPASCSSTTPTSRSSRPRSCSRR